MPRRSSIRTPSVSVGQGSASRISSCFAARDQSRARTALSASSHSAQNAFLTGDGCVDHIGTALPGELGLCGNQASGVDVAGRCHGHQLIVTWCNRIVDREREPTAHVRLLSPFDPALRDRARAERLFGFRYRIEIFVPEAKRRYGYYVFPVMQGDRIIGRIDAKRVGNALDVSAFWPEAGVRMGQARTLGLKSELERVRHLAGVNEVDYSETWLQQ